MIFENEDIYKMLKKIFTYVFPALIYLFETLNDIWNIPYGLQISGSLIAVWVAFGIFLGISKHKYNSVCEINGLEDGEDVGVG